MIKAEFLKLNKQKFFILISIILLIVPVIFQLVYNNFAKYPAYWGYYIQEYNSYEEIDTHVFMLKEMKDTLDISSDLYDEEMQLIENSIRVYEFLKENNIKYNEAINYLQYDVSTDASSYISILGLIISLALFFIASLTCLFVVNNDFSQGVASFVYGGRSLKKRLNAKLIAIHLISFACLIYFIIIISILKNAYSYEYEYLLFISKNDIRLISSTNLIKNIILTIILDYFIISLYSTCLSLLAKKSSFFILFQIIIVLSIFLIVMFLQNEFFTAFINQYIIAFSLGYGDIKYLFIYLSKIIILATCCFFSYKYFAKRNY